VKKGENGKVLLQGIIVPRDEKEEYIRALKKGVAFEIFRAIGLVFGFEVRPLEESTNG